MAQIVFRVKKAKQYNLAKLEALIIKGLTEEAAIDKRMLKKVSKSWKTQPTYQQKLKRGFNSISMPVFTTDKKMHWLDKGTKVRRALMSPDFRAKTRVRKIGSGAGRGRRVAVSRRFSLPGIEAREWTKEIVKRRQPKFKRKMQRAINKGIKR